MYDSIFPTFHETVVYLLFRTGNIAPVPSTEEFRKQITLTHSKDRRTSVALNA